MSYASLPVPATLMRKKPKDNLFARNKANILYNQGNSSIIKLNQEDIPNQQYSVSNQESGIEGYSPNDDSNLS
jgi:hypothetical protein